MSLEQTTELANLYLTLGAGGLCIVVLVGLLIFAIVRIHPAINYMTTNLEVTKQAIQNNTDAIKEMSRSNDNMTTAVTILSSSMTNITGVISSVDSKTDDIKGAVEIIKDRTGKGD